jgi:hypothetical protein
MDDDKPPASLIFMRITRCCSKRRLAPIANKAPLDESAQLPQAGVLSYTR